MDADRPATVPGEAHDDADWILGPPSRQAREATWWTVAGYTYVFLVVPVLDLLDDSGTIPDLDGPAWPLLFLLGAVIFTTAVVWAWRGRQPRPGGRTTASRRRFWWTLALAGGPAVYLTLFVLGLAAMALL